MAKLRANHSRSSQGTGFMARLVVLSSLLILAIFVTGYYLIQDDAFESFAQESELRQKYLAVDYVDGTERFFLPEGSEGQLVHHLHYSLSYNEKYEIPEWVSYILTKESIQAPNVSRSKKFRPDYDVKTRSAEHKDYRNSGYTRGHMVPAGDMAFSTQAMEETFYMSNMCPQSSGFNGGIWRELEELVRDWAYENKKLVVISGPILDGISERIGKNKVGVPKQFFKVLLDLEEPKLKAIGFLIPHESSDQKLSMFTVSVDEIEQITGLDFFNRLIDDNLEEDLESRFNVDLWDLNDKAYR